MYDKTTLLVLEQIYLNPGIHKRELSRKIKMSMPSVENSLKKTKKIVKEEKSGNQIKYSLDYSKQAATPVLSSIEYIRIERLPFNIKTAIRDFLSELEGKPVLAVLFGSYAKGNYTKDSDIDILLVYQKLEKEKEIENTTRKISLRTSTKISPVYLDYQDFKNSFHNLTKEFFKNLKKNKIVIIGEEYWRQLENEEA